jgi:hypothetical protein
MKFFIDRMGCYLSLLSIKLGTKVFAVSDDGPNGFCPGERYTLDTFVRLIP